MTEAPIYPDYFSFTYDRILHCSVDESLAAVVICGCAKCEEARISAEPDGDKP